MELKNGQKISLEAIYLEEIEYGVEPKFYLDSGVRRIHKFIDIDNNLYVWRTSKICGILQHDKQGTELFIGVNPGDMITLEGTIKDADAEYKGESQILITRAKIKKLIEKDYLSEQKLIRMKQDRQLALIKEDYSIKTVLYKEYKEEYSNCQVLVDSFKRTDDGCFIDIIELER